MAGVEGAWRRARVATAEVRKAERSARRQAETRAAAARSWRAAVRVALLVAAAAVAAAILVAVVVGIAAGTAIGERCHAAAAVLEATVAAAGCTIPVAQRTTPAVAAAARAFVDVAPGPVAAGKVSPRRQRLLLSVADGGRAVVQTASVWASTTAPRVPPPEVPRRAPHQLAKGCCQRVTRVRPSDVADYGRLVVALRST